MSTIWITGARGFIGRHLAAYLSGVGHVVSGLGHGAWPADQCRKWGIAVWLNGDIDAHNLQQLLAQAGSPEAIYHLAGGSAVGPSFVSPLEDFCRTVDSTARLLDWVRRESATTKIVCISSAAVYGSGHSGPIAEESPLSPCSPYGFHKAIMEMLCRSYAANFQLKIAIARFFSVYGQGLEKQLLWDICCKLSSNPSAIRLGGTGEEVRDWIHIADVVRLLALTQDICSPSCPVINGGSGIGTTVSEVVRRICRAWESRTAVEFDGNPRSGDPACLVADIQRTRILGFAAHKSPAEGIIDVVRWFKVCVGQ